MCRKAELVEWSRETTKDGNNDANASWEVPWLAVDDFLFQVNKKQRQGDFSIFISARKRIEAKVCTACSSGRYIGAKKLLIVGVRGKTKTEKPETAQPEKSL